MRKLSIATFLLSSIISLSAQNCPPSGIKGEHIVQKGETLYGIARSYGMKTAELVANNNLDPNAVLQPCTKLAITTMGLPKTVRNTVDVEVPQSYNNVGKVSTKSQKSVYVKSNETFHTVQSGDNLEDIAEKYGYTKARLMAMNNIESENGFYVGQELRVNECPCNQTLGNNNNNEPAPNNGSEFAQNSSYDVPQTASTTINQSSSSGMTATPNYTYFNTSRYVPFYHIVSGGESVESIARQYNLNPQDVMMMNNLSSAGALQAGTKLMLEDRSQITQANYVTPNNETTPPQYQPQNTPAKEAQYQPTYQYNVPNTQQPQSDIPENSTSKQAPSIDNSTSMNNEEIDMTQEINLVRNNPVAYIPYIEAYIKELQQNGDRSTSTQTAYELIAELRKTSRLSTLQPLQCLYVAARKHGNDQRKRGATDHQGSDGSWPWDRVTRECTQLKDGNENLVGGPASIRKAVILLLVDDGIEGRGHRKTMLNPDWKYVACHKMGTIGDMPNCWVQKYGF